MTPMDGGVVLYDVPIAVTGAAATSAFTIVVNPNAERLDLQGWFEHNVDPSGALLRAGSYEFRTLAAGRAALVFSGRLPNDYDDPIAITAYVLLQDSYRVVSIAAGQDNNLASVGYDTPDALERLLLDIVGAVEVHD